MEIKKEFIEGKIKLTYENGMMREITLEQMKVQKERWLKQKKQIEEIIARIDEDLSKMQ